jgi:diguanylate cyclase (GGDEF)-like protein
MSRVLPAAAASLLAPGVWTILAAAGVAVATAGFLYSGLHCGRALTAVEAREQQLQSAVAASQTRIAALEAAVRESSAHDDVTGTFNRRTFLTRLDEAIRRDARLQKPIAFLLVDIESFKKINAEAGRLIGDRVLRTVGRAIQASTRGTDFVGRIGGDEFAVVLGECLDPRPAVDRLLVALHGETTGGDHPLPVHVSVGCVTIPGNHTGIDPALLFRIAEDALGTVKGGGLSRCSRREYPVEDLPPVTVHHARGL